MPFCQVRRLTTQKSGAVGRFQAEARLDARAVGGAPAERARRVGARRGVGSVAGFHTSVSMPLTMPVSTSRAGAQQAVEAHAAARRADLGGVGRADGGDRVGELQAALQEADIAVILDAVDARRLRRAGRRSAKIAGGKLPWKARLWMVMTDRAVGGRRHSAR